MAKQNNEMEKEEENLDEVTLEAVIIAAMLLHVWILCIHHDPRSGKCRLILYGPGPVRI